MRENVKEWKKEWIDTNGETNELEVSINDSSLDEFASPIYEGSFAGIPEELEEMKVIEWGKICNSSLPERVGIYSLTI